MYIANTIQLLSGIASDLLEGAIAEGADETGVLVLVQSHARLGEPYCGSIEAPHSARRRRRTTIPGLGLEQASFLVSVPSLRKKLFGI